MTFEAPSARVSSARSMRADAAADPAWQHAADVRDERVVVARPLRRVQVDQLHLRAAAEPGDPPVDVAGFDGEPLALHELDDPAPLEID